MNQCIYCERIFNNENDITNHEAVCKAKIRIKFFNEMLLKQREEIWKMNEELEQKNLEILTYKIQIQELEKIK